MYDVAVLVYPFVENSTSAVWIVLVLSTILVVYLNSAIKSSAKLLSPSHFTITVFDWFLSKVNFASAEFAKENGLREPFVKLKSTKV